jgi:hypothetical protein
MTAPNVLLLLDQNILAAIADCEAEEIDAMDCYTAAREKRGQLEALLELRRRCGARITGLPSVVSDISGAA